MLGSAPAERARAAHRRLEALPPDAGGDGVKTTPLTAAGERGYAVGVGDEFTFAISERDVETGEKLDKVAAEAARRLADRRDARREQRRLPVILRGVALSLAATAVLALLLWLMVRFRRWLTAVFTRIAHERVAGIAKRWADVEGVLLSIVRVALLVLLWTLMIAAADVWLTFVLGCFPLTRPWSRVLTAQVVELLAGVGAAIVGYLPSLAMLAVIFIVARFVASLVKSLLARHPGSAGPARAPSRDGGCDAPDRHRVRVVGGARRRLPLHARRQLRGLQGAEPAGRAR